MSDPTHKAVTVIEHRDVEKLSPIVAASMAILRENPNPETLEKLLAVQERYEAGEARKKYAQALVDLKRDLPTTLRRNKDVKFGSTDFSYTTMAAACDQLIPILAQYGFALTFDPGTSERGVTVKCQLRHAGGHVEESAMSAANDTTGPMKNLAQQAMSSVTRLQRYLMLSMLGVATGDMPDADDQPQGATDPEQVDTARNLRFVGWLREHGVTREQAEKFAGRKVQEWTAADIEAMAAEAKAAGPAAPAPAKASQSDALTAFLAGVESSSSVTELKAIAKHAEKLGDEEKAQARAAYVARLARVKPAGAKASKPANGNDHDYGPPMDDEPPPAEAA